MAVKGDVVLANGEILTEEMMDELDAQLEQGILPGKTVRMWVAPSGRPRLSEEELVPLAFKVPRSQREAIDCAAAERDQTRSEFLRDAVAAALASS